MHMNINVDSSRHTVGSSNRSFLTRNKFPEFSASVNELMTTGGGVSNPTWKSSTDISGLENLSFLLGKAFEFFRVLVSRTSGVMTETADGRGVEYPESDELYEESSDVE